MMKSVFYAVIAAMIASLCLVTEVRADIKESWYMSRGKANMEIENYKAAIESFEKLVAINPDNQEAMRLLGRAYELQGLTDKAIEHYDRYLKRFPNDADIAFKQARYLEDARFSYRKKDAIQYYRMGLKQKPDYENRHRLARLLAGERNTFDEAAAEYKLLVRAKPGDAVVRLEYARLLAAHHETIDPAIEQYNILVDRNPGNSTAHRELAAAYAWKGDNDRAIYHSKLALRYDSQDKSAKHMRDDLMQGREPRMKAGFTYFNQSGNDSHYAYSGYLLKAGGQADITPFLTGEAEIGLERYGHGETVVEGTFYQLNLQGRFDPTRRIDAELKYHDLNGAENDSEFLVQYSTQQGRLLITPGIRRAFKYDSLLAIAGDTDSVTGRKIGSARSNTAFFRLAFEGERIQASATPYAGYVSANGTNNNSLVGADADARYLFTGKGAFVFSLLYKFQTSHYAHDNSGFVDSNNAPFAGGYFSPNFFVNNALHLEIGYRLQPDSELRLSAGPSFQYTKRHSNTGEQNTGLDLDLTYRTKVGPSLYLSADGSYYQVADVYRRFDGTVLLTYKF
jgi:tetratricopeptide (TPR) repeat protein